ncbi:glycine--tRNA ligase subunit beta [Enterobacteriaceae endosymbiont of Donacia tomentosa]|uniref:glycine--tRNA ligase subunit beta n=1 Tax=Enterobacteriaceae endosymbiont of Donacia tomentosa TaxID=2675787 RepID=UPI00144A26CD|nr:glycine--tRNA ligase subunit beta [Enterobacteriaceae endosymbiont of Donacia tomentosa]QJC31512.1 glycine--tRNA ligase subunit beta [Enterobacteriaceae endosymbiont of Donacia tomentosa]
MNNNTLLLEVGVEDIPSKYLLKITKIVFENFKNELKKNNFKYKIIKFFSTSRRIAIQIVNLSVFQLDSTLIIKGPFVTNKKNMFLLKEVRFWIKKQKIKNTKEITYKNNYLFYKKKIKGLHIKKILPNMIFNSLNNISLIPNLMYWDTHYFKFIRPIRSFTFVLGKKIIKNNILNIKSNNLLQGNRFMCNKKIILKNAEEYEMLLFKKGKVIVNFIQRKNKILNNINKIINSLNAHIKITNVFLEELTAMVEWPTVLLGQFNKKFLCLPSKILEYVMINYQKYIPLYDKNNKLLPNFIFLINIETKNENVIISDNEQVLQAKFQDVKFFFENDTKIKLEEYLNKLKNILFQKELGSLFEKTIRIEKLSKYIAKIINANILYCIRASRLSKCDLATQMVYEFPDLQGIVGMYYAKHNKENIEIIKAIKEQYQYKINDKIPKSVISCTLFIADKIDTLVGIFSIYSFPTGNKDPYALKRIALFLVRIIITNKLKINLVKLINFNLHLYNYNSNNNNIYLLNKILDFIINRCKNWYISLGYKKIIVTNVLKNKTEMPLILDYKIKALDKFFKSEKQQSFFLIYTNKRIDKILLKNTKNINYDFKINMSLLQKKEEIKLVNYIIKLSKILKNKIKNYEFYNILLILSELYYPINDFFKKVKINDEKIIIKNNRITILYNVKKYLSTIINLQNLY